MHFVMKWFLDVNRYKPLLGYLLYPRKECQLQDTVLIFSRIDDKRKGGWARWSMLLEKEATPLETVRDIVGGSRTAGIGAEAMEYLVQMRKSRVFAGPVAVDRKA